MEEEIHEPPPHPLPEMYIPSAKPSAPSNEDLGQMLLQTNRSMNYVVKKLTKVDEKVDSQESVIDILRDIQRYVKIGINVFAWVGSSGLLLSAINWLTIHWGK